jgi:hypothetical protein
LRADQPGVNWISVEACIQRCRIAGRVNDTLLRQVDPDQPVRGVARLDRVKAHLDWSDRDVADTLGVYPSAVLRYRLSGVPDRQLRALRMLQCLDRTMWLCPARFGGRSGSANRRTPRRQISRTARSIPMSATRVCLR